ncbi:chorismate mutase [Basidiobolus meristosporus CBS 931.73]|uniref:Chorismate mutase n=1 Tax=Basidiobolus meristosporus CBS 931.73 TaxID=1314790 RepID=A0A1Y1XWB4_9FUNG|nr:chorismate mutase [Basidiobolus meristosporus CBS 931.73]|eukprot:ORX90023.1 chorismate mutase [Basidiobolus meristosporus CBS 931.73]
MDFLKTGNDLPLDQFRDTLIRLEDTIIFALIERAQFATNNSIYQVGKFKFEDRANVSFLEYILHELEISHAKVRRYTSPDEYPFTSNLPEPILPPLDYPKILHPNNININKKLYEIYIQKIVPTICAHGDDLNYGTSATRDVECLQALSRRIHYGKFIAEAKFNDPELHDQYVQLIKARDSQGIYDLLTNLAVEEKLLKRLRHKASIYGQDISTDGAIPDKVSKIAVDAVIDLYKDYVIPLTKEVEVEYLLMRLDE